MFNFISNIKHYTRNRWITKSHALVSSKLALGHWHDYDERLLHCAFDGLVDFVEMELAWLETLSDKYKNYLTPRWYELKWRCPEAGRTYLKRESQDTYGYGHDQDGELTTNALSAQEILALYDWWTYKRPVRPDPSTAMEHLTPSVLFGILKGEVEESPIEYHQRCIAFNKYELMQEAYDKEDTNMLIRLINVRSNLWT